MQYIQAWSLGGEDPLEEGMAIHSSIPGSRIPWTEAPGGLQSKRSQRVGHDWSHLARTTRKLASEQRVERGGMCHGMTLISHVGPQGGRSQGPQSSILSHVEGVQPGAVSGLLLQWMLTVHAKLF